MSYPPNPFPAFFTSAQWRSLLANHNHDTLMSKRPVVKLFTPDGPCTWLLISVDPQEPYIAFGLCDLGLGFPELGSVSLSELAALRGALGLPVERDRHAKLTKSLRSYCDLANRHQEIRA